MDNSSNTTIGLKKGFGTTFRLKKKLRILDELSHLWYFSSFPIFLKYSDDLPVVGHVDFILDFCPSILSRFSFIKLVLLQKCSTVLSE